MTKYPAISPLDALVDLACRDGIDVRPTLLRVLTDLYVQKPAHSAEEEIQYVELALGLIDTVDDPTRAAVASSLSAYPAAPAAIMVRLGAATSVSASPAVERETANLLELFFAASSEERRLILLNLDAAVTTPTRLPAPAAGEIVKLLENAALQRNTGGFSRTLARALGIGVDLAERIVRDPSGEPIVVATRALGMNAAVLQRILLFLNPAVGQSVQTVYDLAQLFDELSREAAARMLAIWRNESVTPEPVQKPAYAPAYGADGASDNRAHPARRAVPTPEREADRARKRTP